jgi:hypothetical protein
LKKLCDLLTVMEWVHRYNQTGMSARLRKDITYHICYQSSTELIERVHSFEQDINSNPFEISDHLWVKNHLEEDEEKLRVST